MLATAARQAGRLSGTKIFSRLAPTRALSAAAQMSEVQRLDPSTWFSDFDAASVRAELNQLREVENEIFQIINTKVVPVDWEYWAQEIKHPGIVSELKELHDNTPIPNIAEATAKSQQEIEDVFNPIIEEFQKITEAAREETAQLEEETRQYTFLRDNIGELPIDEFLAKYPSVTKSIEEDISNNKWFIRE